MIDDQVRHQVHILPQFFDICPSSQAGIDLGVIDRVKAGIGTVNGIIEWENVNAAEQPGKRSFEQSMQSLYIAPAQAICIRDELDFIFHGVYICCNVLSAAREGCIQGCVPDGSVEKDERNVSTSGPEPRSTKTWVR